MKVLLRSDHIASVPKRWDKQYPTSRWGEDKREIACKLLALPPGFTAEQCNEIIGNKSWTHFTCDECDKDVDKLIDFGDNPINYGGNHFSVCIKCLRKAVKTLNAT